MAELANLLQKARAYRNSDTDNHIEPSDYVCVDSQVVSTETLTDDDIVNKIRGEIEDEDGAETDKGWDEIDASADTQETPEISAQDALKAITTLKTFFMQKTDTSDSIFSMLIELNELIETFKKITKNNCPSRSFCLSLNDHLHKHPLCYF